MTFYLLYYVIIAFVLTIGYIFKNKIFTYLSLLIIILISGFRYEVGYDYPNYVSFFLGYGLERVEPLFVFILLMLKNIWDDPQIMFFTFSLATILIAYKAIKKLGNSERMGIMIYLLIPGLYLNSFSIIRQSIAISLFFLGIFYLYENKKIKYWIIGIIAILLHFSAIIPFVFMWIFKKWFTKKLNIVFHFTFLSVAFIIAYLKLPKLFIGMFGRFSVYAELLTIETPITKVLVMFFLGVIIVYFLRNKDDKKTNLLLNILQIGIFINIVFAEFPPVTRMGYYFVITQTVLVPAIIFSFKYNYFRIFSLVLFMTYYSFIQINALITDEKQSETIKMTPYKSYLDK